MALLGLLPLVLVAMSSVRLDVQQALVSWPDGRSAR